MQQEGQNTEKLQDLLKGELSAVEAYSLVEEKFEGDPELSQLMRIRHDHQEAVSHLKTEVRMEHEKPQESSGPWGSVVQSYVSGAKLAGQGAMLKALKQGEEYGIQQYQKLLSDENIDGSVKQIVQGQFLPQQREHIATLQSMIDRQ